MAKKKKVSIPKTISEMKRKDPKLYEYFLYVKMKTGQTFKDFIKNLK